MAAAIEDIEALLGFLLDARASWTPEGFDMLGLIGHAGAAPSGLICLSPIAEGDDIEISERLFMMSPTRQVSFEEIVGELSREWRLPMIKAYCAVKEMSADRVLVPVKPLSTDPSGHFVQMRFRLPPAPVEAGLRPPA